MKDKMRRNDRKGRGKERTVAPGFTDERFGENATKNDMEKGNYTKVTRVFLDENDPS